MQNRRLYLIVNVTPGRQPSPARLRAALKSGVDIVQLRCKEMTDKAFLEHAFRLRRLSRANKLLFIVNDRADIALASEADGLHIGQGDIPPHLARKIIGNNKILGLSTHNLAQIKEAKPCREIDYIGVGPVFRTDTKPGSRPIGLSLIRYISKDKGVPPAFAIGGVTVNNIERLAKAGAKRVAFCNAIFNSRRPAAVVNRFKKALYDSD